MISHLKEIIIMELSSDLTLQALRALQVQVNSELEACTTALDAHKAWAFQALSSQYESEMKKYRQLAALYTQELERCIALLQEGGAVDMNWEWVHTAKQASLLYFHSYRRDFPLRKAVVRQFFSNPFTPKAYFDLFRGIASEEVSKSVKKARKAVQTLSLRKVTRAIWTCELVSKCAPFQSNEGIPQLLSRLSIQADKLSDASATHSYQTASKDCHALHSISRTARALLKLDGTDKLSVCRSALHCLPPLSTSLSTARLLWTLGSLTYASEQEEARERLQSALHVLKTHHPTEVWTADFAYRWAKIEGEKKTYEEAVGSIQRVCASRALRGGTGAIVAKELAECWQQLGSKGQSEEVAAYTASISQTFNPKQSKSLTRLLRSLYL